jgi:hypothetical protein
MTADEPKGSNLHVWVCGWLTESQMAHHHPVNITMLRSWDGICNNSETIIFGYLMLVGWVILILIKRTAEAIYA